MSVYPVLFSEAYLFVVRWSLNTIRKSLLDTMLGITVDFFFLKILFFFSPDKKQNSLQLQMLDENSLETATNSTITLKTKMDTSLAMKKGGNY